MSIAKLEHEIAVPSRAPDGSRQLRVVHDRERVNLPAAERAVRDLLRALGRDPASAHLADTPRRVAESFTEMLTPREFDLTTFPNDEHYDELVLARNIPVHSLCEHHMLPFTGVAHVGYLPGERILGLSKLARVVELFARDLQVQERLTVQVANWLQENLAPHGSRCRGRGRAHVHVHAGGQGRGIEDDYVCRAWRATRGRTFAPGVLRADMLGLSLRARLAPACSSTHDAAPDHYQSLTTIRA